MTLYEIVFRSAKNFFAAEPIPPDIRQRVEKHSAKAYLAYCRHHLSNYDEAFPIFINVLPPSERRTFARNFKRHVNKYFARQLREVGINVVWEYKSNGDVMVFYIRNF